MSLQAKYTVRAASQRSGLAPELIVRFIAFAWICPRDPVEDLNESILDEEDLARIILIKQLQGDLGANDDSVPIILHLIDQLNRTHLELRRWVSKNA